MASISLSSVSANAILAVAQQRVATDKLNLRVDERQVKLDQDRLDKDLQRVSAEKKLAQQAVKSDAPQALSQSLAPRVQAAKLGQQTGVANASGAMDEPVTIGGIINTHA